MIRFYLVTGPDLALVMACATGCAPRVVERHESRAAAIASCAWWSESGRLA